MKKIIFNLVFMLLAGVMFAENKGAGTTSSEFLKIIGSARSVALGGSYVVLDDMNNIGVNPALTGYSTCFGLALNEIRFFQDVNYLSFYGTYKHPTAGGFSVGFINLNSGPIPLTTTDPVSTSTMIKNDFAVSLAYGRDLGFTGVDQLRNLYLGIDLKYYYEGFGDINYQGMNFDFGAIYKFARVEGLSAGIALLNLKLFSGDTNKNPLNFKTGARYDFNLYDLNKRHKDISLLLDVEKTDGMNVNIATGLEARFIDMVSARLGYRFLHDTGWISFGVGVELQGFELSYSFSPYKDLGYDNQFSINYTFDCPDAGPRPGSIINKRLTDVYNIDVVRDCYSFSETKDMVMQVEVLEQDQAEKWELVVSRKKVGGVLRKIGGDGDPPAKLTWDGKDEEGKALPDGAYYSKLTVFFKEGGYDSLQSAVYVDSAAPRIAISVDKNLFSPDSDGYDDSLTFNIESKDECGITNWRISVFDDQKTVVKTIEGSGEPPATYVWDGKDNQNNIVPQWSQYTYKLTVLDHCGHESTAQSVLELKTDVYVQRLENGDLVLNLEGVEFDTAKYSLRQVSSEILDRAIAILQRDYIKDKEVEIGGHTDNQGGYDYNINLSKNRAKTVMEYFISGGIVADRLSFNGYGYTKPIADNNTAAGRQKNRRVELIVKVEPMPQATIITNKTIKLKETTYTNNVIKSQKNWQKKSSQKVKVK